MTLIQKMILDCVVVVVVVVLRTHLGVHFQKKIWHCQKRFRNLFPVMLKWYQVSCHKKKRKKEKWHCLQHNDAYTSDEAMEINVSLPTNNMED